MTTSGGERSAPAPSTRSRQRFAASVLIGLVCLLIYNANLRSISAGDTYAARFLPFAILGHQTLRLDPVATITAQGRADKAFWMLPRPGGHVVSFYPVVAPVVVAPLYLPAVGYLHWRGWSDARLDHIGRIMEKVSASFIAALSAALLYLLLLRRTSSRNALLLTVAYALGTTSWVISSQALWQHGVAGLFVIAALLFLTGPPAAARAFAVGIVCGLIVGNRPPDVVLAAALGAYALFWGGWRRVAWLVAGGAVSSGAVLFYNQRIVGHLGGGYALHGDAAFFDHGLWTGIAGVLFSPTRGLFVFSPFLLFLVLAWRYWPRLREERALTLAMSIAVALQVVLYAKSDWRAGYSWGPRYMTDLLPFLIWMLVPVVDALRGIARICFLGTVAVAIAIQAIGAFCYIGDVDAPIFVAGHGPQEMRAAWNWRNASFLTARYRGLAPGELLLRKRGSFDGIESFGHRVTTAIAGEEVVATGWALTGNATPWQVAITIDGHRSLLTRDFSDRPDVRAMLQTTSACGWRVPIDTSGLAPGEHTVAVSIWASEKGENYYLAERKLTIVAPQPARVATPADLEEASRLAAARLRERQQPDGFWLTAFTTGTRLSDPRPEMNVFLTALLVDLLEPVAIDGGLQETLQRARVHLTGQIESDGLVRYHGRPDGPAIGTLGCAITPDTDNTALVWRIAPASDRERLTSALATIERYRTSEGLYRTWLAPRDQFQCLDPGDDPNPADIAIQMHLLLLLSDARPAAGHALCEALRPLVDEDRIWVYYRNAPLVPMLRLADLQRAGCALNLPESRMRTNVRGQEIWVSVARLLSGGKSDAAESRSILHELARNDFAAIRKNPPLLYHNDLTATVPRYYWSEDVGYALWLNLYERNESFGDPVLHD